MLTPLQTFDPLQIAAGQFTEVRCTILGSESLIGKAIGVNVAAFIDDVDAVIIGTEPYNNVFRGLYPTLPSTTECIWIGAPQLTNWRCFIEAIDATHFDIVLKFIATTDIGTYTSLSPVIPNTSRFTLESVGGTSVYSQAKYLVLAVWESQAYPPAQLIEDIAAKCVFEFSGNWFNNDATFITPEDGFIIGQDLEVDILLPTEGDFAGIGADFYVGIIRDTPETPGNLVTAHELGYAQLLGTILDVDDLDNPFISGNSFILGPTTLFQAQVTIENEYFDPDQCYRIYIVYFQFGEWHSAISDPICNVGAPNVPTYGDIEPSITQGEVTHDVGCVTGVAPSETLTICAIMSEAGYNAAALTNGVPGNYLDNLAAINVYQADEIPAELQGIVPIEGLTLLGTTTDGCYTFQIPESWTGLTKFIVFEYVFKIPNIEPYEDHIYFAIPVSVIDSVTDGKITVTSVHNVDDEEFLNGIICLEYIDVVKINLTHSSGGADTIEVLDPLGIVIEADEAFVAGTAQIIVDAKLLSISTEKCIKIISTDDVIENSECSPCPDITLTLEVLSTGNGLANLSLNYSLIGLVSSVHQVIITPGSGAAEVFTEDSGQLNFQVQTNNQYIEIQFIIQVQLENGCIFNTAPSIEVANVEASFNTIEYNICDDEPDGSSLCNNIHRIHLDSCFLSLGELVADVSFDDSLVTSPIDTDTKEYSTDGGDTWIPYVSNPIPSPIAQTTVPPTLVRWTLTFTDGCPSQSVFIPLLCPRSPEPLCNNKPTINCEYDPDAETLTVTVTNNIGGSEISDPQIFYSEDGGATFLDYSIPIDIDPGVDQIIVYAVPLYTDDCPEGPTLTCTWNRDDVLSQCNYEDYTVTSDYDSDTGSHVPTFTGDETLLETNIKEYSLDGGVTWATYTGANPGGMLVLFRWTIGFGGQCCEETRLSASSSTAGIGQELLRIVGPDIVLSALGAPEDTFTLNLPAGYEFINIDHVMPYLNNAIIKQTDANFGWTFNTATGEVTHATPFDPADWTPGDTIHYEYWVRTT